MSLKKRFEDHKAGKSLSQEQLTYNRIKGRIGAYLLSEPQLIDMTRSELSDAVRKVFDSDSSAE